MNADFLVRCRRPCQPLGSSAFICMHLRLNILGRPKISAVAPRDMGFSLAV